MSNIPQVSNGLDNPIRNFQVLLGDKKAFRVNGETLEINAKRLELASDSRRKELLFSFNYLNEFGAEFPSSVLIHVTQENSKTHLSNGNEQVIADNEIIRFDLLENRFC